MVAILILMPQTAFGFVSVSSNTMMGDRLATVAPGTRILSSKNNDDIVGLPMDLSQKVESFLLGSLFSNGKETAKLDDDNPRKELLLLNDLEEFVVPPSADEEENPTRTISTRSSSGIESAQASLLNFLQLWARQLEDDKGLTTAIAAKHFQRMKVSAEGDAKDDTATTDTSTTACSLGDKHAGGGNSSVHLRGDDYHSMKLTFRPPKRYLSYKEQKSMEKGVLPDRKGAKVDAWSPGGVELLVSIVVCQKSTIDSTTSTESTKISFVAEESTWENQPTQSSQQQVLALQLQVLRCDIDGDTIIKYTTERAIVRRLKDGIRIWRKVRAMKVVSSSAP